MATSTRVSHEDFVVAWMTADSAEQVAKTTNMNINAVYSRANALRKAGVKLPLMKRHNSLDDLKISQLNSLVNRHKQGR